MHLLRHPATALSNFYCSPIAATSAHISGDGIYCKDHFFRKGEMKGEVGRHGARRKEIWINKFANPPRLYHPTLSLLLSSPKSNSWWHKKGEFVLMFVQSWGNLLDRDLANQNSLQKLSDPGGSRALDKQDWLFQRHAYITPIWAQAISHRQPWQYKPDSYRRIVQENMARSVDFFMQGKQAPRDAPYKLLESQHMTDTMLNVSSPAQKICMTEQFVRG